MKRLGAILLAILFTSCSSEEKSTSTLRLGAMSSLDYIPYVLAEQLGYTDSLGVDLEIVKFFSANDRDAAFRAGQVDGTVTDYTGAAIQQAAGLPLAIVVKHDGYFELMAQPTFTTMADLKGKKISISKNTVIDYATSKMLQSAGINNSEVEYLDINKIPIRMEMLLTNEVDASVFPDPFITIAKSKGLVVLASTRDLGISITGTIFSQEAIEQKGKAIKTLLQAYNLAVDYINSHPRKDWQHILVEEAGVPAELVEQVVLPNYTHAELPDPTDINETIIWLQSQGLVPRDYTGVRLVYSGFY